MRQKIVKDFRKNKWRYLLVLSVVLYFLIFHYKSMYGLIIAFKNFRPARGIGRSPWVGLENFRRFFNDFYFCRVLRNTFTISMLSIVFAFPAPILLALLLNEVRSSWIKRSVQTVTYMPHFIALVIVCSILTSFCQTNGAINDIIVFFGGERQNLLSQKELFYPIYILSGIMPTISMLLILKLGHVLSVGYEKILLLYNPTTCEVADVISTYVYRKGLFEADYSYATAIGLFNSVINVIFLLVANKVSKKMGQSGLF